MCLIFFKKSRIPIKDTSDYVKNFKKIYDKFKFENLNNLFDISYQNAPNYIMTTEDNGVFIFLKKPYLSYKYARCEYELF